MFRVKFGLINYEQLPPALHSHQVTVYHYSNQLNYDDEGKQSRQAEDKLTTTSTATTATKTTTITIYHNYYNYH